MRGGTPLIALLLFTAVSAAASEALPRTSWYLMPTVGFDTDDGLGFGGRLEIARKVALRQPPRWALIAESYLTVEGYQSHLLEFDRADLGTEGRWRVTGRAIWRQWAHDGYWGIGGGTVREASDSQAATRHDYQLRQSLGHVVIRARAAGPWRLYGTVSPRKTAVDTYPGSLLEEQQPYGMAGGPTVLVGGGALRDTRDEEVAPREGTLLELGARAAPDLVRRGRGGEAGGFGGPLLSLSGFAEVSSRTVVAGRLAGEWLAGTVPFYEMNHWGGIEAVEGFGGADTLRGVDFGRWRAPGKAIANLELRVALIEHRFRGAPVVWEVAPTADVGVVSGAGDDATSAPPEQPLHPAVGGGVRVIYDRLFVGRFDVGVGPDPIEGEDGEEQVAQNVGMYLVFGHPF